MYSFNPYINAPQTYGIIPEIDAFDTLNRYIKLLYESPVANNRKVIANLVVIAIAFLSHFLTFSKSF